MRRVIHFAQRNKILVAATAALMLGAGCIGAVRETGDQLTEDALTPITVPLEARNRAIDAASSVDALRKAQQESYGE